MIIGDYELKKEEVQLLEEWLKDYRGKPFWKWIKLQSSINHDLASKPIGQNAITDIIHSQRCLSAENAFDQCSNFRHVFIEIEKKEKDVDKSVE